MATRHARSRRHAEGAVHARRRSDRRVSHLRRCRCRSAARSTSPASSSSRAIARVVHHANIRLDPTAGVARARCARSGAGLRRLDGAIGRLSRRGISSAGRRGRWRRSSARHGVAARSRHRSRRPAPHAAEWRPRAGTAADRSVLRRSAADADADDPSPRVAGHRHPAQEKAATRSPTPTCLPADVALQAVQPHAHYRLQVGARHRDAFRTDANER